VEYPPKVPVSNLVNSLKGVLWSPSYFASSCGGPPISIVRQYIEQQRTPH
jgi:putative transposase